jgi:hypothetical protein
MSGPQSGHVNHLATQSFQSAAANISVSKHKLQLYKISGFRREVAENCSLLSYYAASIGNFLPTFLDNLSDLSSRVNIEDGTEFVPKRRLEITTTRCLIT